MMTRDDIRAQFRHWRRFGYRAVLSLKLARLNIALGFSDYEGN